VAHSSLLTSVLQEGVRNGVFPGAVLFVRHQGRIRFHEAVGTLSNLPTSPPVQPHTLYDLASLTKPLATASAILLLIQDGVLGLHVSLHATLDETKNHLLGAKTVRDLLCHQSGLPAWRPYYQDFSSDRVYDRQGYRQREAAVLKKVLNEPLDELCPRKSVYSDLGYMVLGFLVERVTGQTLADFCRTRIFQPLQAEPLGYRSWEGGWGENEREQIAPTEQDPWRGRLLQGEVHDENAYVLGGMAGHAGLFGTANAVGQVTDAWLAAYQEKPGLFDCQFVKQFVMAQSGTSWALGWDTPSHPSSSGQLFSPESFGHLGFTGTSIWIDPVRELEVIFLSNRVHPTRENQAIKAFRPNLHDAILQEVIINL